MFMLLRPHQWVRGRWPWGYGSVLSIIILVVLEYSKLHKMVYNLVVCEIRVFENVLHDADIRAISRRYACWM